MATTNETISDIISGPDKLLHKKARGAIVQVARDIIDEAAPVGAFWYVRRKWAERVINNPELAMPRVKVELALTGGIRNSYVADDHTDAAVKNVVQNNLDRIIAETL